MQTLTGNNVALDLEEGIAQAARLQPIEVPKEAQEAVLEFITRRLEQLLVDEGCGVEAVKAVLSERGANAAIAAQSARELQVCWHPRHALVNLQPASEPCQAAVAAHHVSRPIAHMPSVLGRRSCKGWLNVWSALAAVHLRQMFEGGFGTRTGSPCDDHHNRRDATSQWRGSASCTCSPVIVP